MLLSLIRKTLFLVAVASVIVSCVAQKAAQGLADIPCDQITGMNMEALFAAPVDERDLSKQLAARFDALITATPEERIELEGKAVERTWYEWQIGTTRYQLITLDERPRRAVATFPIEHAPALSRVLECLGNPGEYHTRYKGPPDGRRSLWLDLFYPDRGIMVFVQVSDPWFGPHIDPEHPMQSLHASTPIEAIGWVQPGDIPTMDWHWQPPYDQVLAGSQAAFNRTQEWHYRTIRPWPGSIEALELTDTSD